MGRQLFLHHYLPAHLASSLVAGALLEFIFNVEPSESDGSVVDAFDNRSSVSLTTDGSPSKSGKKAVRGRPIRERIGGQGNLASWIACMVILVVVFWGFYFFSPLTYGFPAMDVDQVNRRKWLGYDLHFAK